MKQRIEEAIPKKEGYKFVGFNDGKLVYEPIEVEHAKSWEDLGHISGYYISTNSNINGMCSLICGEDSKNTFAEKHQAEASILYAKLTQLYKAFMEKEGYANWKLKDYKEFCFISYMVYKDTIYSADSSCAADDFNFPNRVLADKFKDLYEKELKEYYKTKLGIL